MERLKKLTDGRTPKHSRSETAIQKSILNYLAKTRKCWAIKVMAANVAGVPDILCCYQGRLLGLEVKRPGGRVTKLQSHHIAEILRNGGFARVVTSVEETRTFLDYVDKEIEG